MSSGEKRHKFTRLTGDDTNMARVRRVDEQRIFPLANRKMRSLIETVC